MEQKNNGLTGKNFFASAVKNSAEVEAFANIKPNTDFPCPYKLADAADRFRQLKNQSILAIEPQHVETMLDYVVAAVRAELNKQEHVNIDTDCLNGTCGTVSATADKILNDDLGLNVNQMNIAQFENEDTQLGRHQFLVVEIPEITGKNSAANKTYLVDLSYRQFVKPIPTYLTPEEGQKLAQTDKGRQLGKALLKNGYAEITPELAKIYVESFNSKETPVLKSEDQYLNVMKYDKCFIDNRGHSGQSHIFPVEVYL